MPMIRRCRCSTLAVARPKPAGCGVTCAMIAHSPAQRRRRCCTTTVRTAKASIREASRRIPRYPSGGWVHRLCRALPEWGDRSGLYGALSAAVLRVHASQGSPLALEALQRIATLYEIEAAIRGKSPEIRLAVRQARSAPLFADLRNWLEQTLTRISGKSDLAGAIRYMLSRWDALTLVLRDGRACIDNNAAERAMRPISLGRKNWLHAGSDAGGERAAAIFSLTETAKLNMCDPEDYLRQVLERIADYPVKRVHELLPWNLTTVRTGWISVRLPDANVAARYAALEGGQTGRLHCSSTCSRRADRHAQSGLARTLGDRHQQDVHDADAADQQ